MVDAPVITVESAQVLFAFFPEALMSTYEGMLIPDFITMIPLSVVMYAFAMLQVNAWILFDRDSFLGVGTSGHLTGFAGGLEAKAARLINRYPHLIAGHCLWFG